MRAWTTDALGAIATIERSSVQPQQIRSGAVYVGLEHITSDGRFLNPQPVANGELASSKFLFSERHLLYGKLRPYLSKIACPDFGGICSTDILPILPGPRVERRYLFHYLRQPQVVEFASSQAVGINLPRLSPSVLASLEIPIPPLPEQRHIADILDRAEALRAKRRDALRILSALADSFFQEMFSGDHRPERTIAELIESGDLLLHKDGNHGGLYPRTEDFGNSGVPFLSAKAVTEDGLVDETEVGMLRSEKAATLRLGWIQEGDVLLAHNASVGKVARYDGRYESALIGTSLTAFRPNPAALDSYYLAAALRSRRFQDQLLKDMGQTTRNQVPITAQRRLRIVMPPIECQREFRARVSILQRIAAINRSSLLACGALFASLQHRAFRGEL